ncbi:TPA: MarR family transcriptional regulator [Serratia marcescens]|nr:MarR family transcriptional regulator [Serratia marcescens]
MADLLLVTGQLVRRLRSLPNTHELPWLQVAILGRLERDGPMTTADLARAEAVKPQSMGAVLAVMEKNGFVERQPHPSDGRQVLLSITEEGRNIRQKVRLVRTEWLMDAMTKFTSEEQNTLAAAVELLRRLGDS